MRKAFQMATAVQAGKHISLGVSRFNVLVAQGVIKRMPAGKYNLDEVRSTYCLHAQRVMAGRAEDGGATLSKQRAKLAAAQTEKAEFQNALARGDFVNVNIMRRFTEVLFTNFREQSLSMAGKISDSLTPFTPKDRTEIYDVIHREVHEMLEEFSNPAGVLGRAIAETAAKGKA
jgi:phage terminase Nu1 subunit (DNA packaging protein)